VKVAVVYPVPFGLQGYYGGGERYPLEFARALARLCSCHYVDFASRPQSCVDDFGLQHTTLPIHWRGSSEFDPMSLSLWQLLRHFDILHFFSLNKMAVLAAASSRLTRTKVVITPVGAGGRSGLRRLGLHRLVAGYLPISEYSCQHDPWMTAKPCKVIYGGGNPSAFATPQPSWPRPRRILFVGRITPHKGVDILLQAAPSEAEVVICGQTLDSEYSQHLRTLAAGRNVRFLNPTDDRSLASAYATSSVCVLPSLSHDYLGRQHAHPELLGLVLLEAMWHGTPVIGSRIGAIPEIVDDGNVGLLVPPGGVKELNAALTLLLDDPARAESMGRRAIEWVRDRFTWQRVAATAFDFYRLLS